MVGEPLPTPEAEPQGNPAMPGMGEAFEAGEGPDSVDYAGRRLTQAELKKKSFGFPRVTRMTREDMADLQYAKEQMGDPPDHYEECTIEDGSGDPYAVVVYDSVARSYTLFKSRLDSDQVEAKWDEVKKGEEDYPDASLSIYDEMLQSPEGTAKTVIKDSKTYVMARLRGGMSREGIRMSVEEAA